MAQLNHHLAGCWKADLFMKQVNLIILERFRVNRASKKLIDLNIS